MSCGSRDHLSRAYSAAPARVGMMLGSTQAGVARPHAASYALLVIRPTGRNAPLDISSDGVIEEKAACPSESLLGSPVKRPRADPPYPTPGSETRQPGIIPTARAWSHAARQAAAWAGSSARMTFSPLRPETSQTSTPTSVRNAVSPTLQPAAWISFRAWSTSS